jgi:hypothetical protein
VGFLALGELGLFAAEPAFGFGDLHAFAGAGADEVRFEFGDHGQDVEEEPSDRVCGVVDGSADAELHVPFGEVFDDVPRVRQGAGEPVEFGDDEGVAGPDGGEGFAQSRPFPVSSGQPSVDVDPVFWDSEAGEPVPLSGEILFVGRNAGVADVRGRGCTCSG